jgi:hypothetical protein
MFLNQAGYVVKFSWAWILAFCPLLEIPTFPFPYVAMPQASSCQFSSPYLLCMDNKKMWNL